MKRSCRRRLSDAGPGRRSRPAPAVLLCGCGPLPPLLTPLSLTFGARQCQPPQTKSTAAPMVTQLWKKIATRVGKKRYSCPPPRKKTRKEEIIKPRVRIKSWKKIAWEILSRFFFSFPHLALLRFIDHRVSRRAGRRTYRNPRPPLAQTVGETVKNLGGHHGQGSMETE